MTKHSPVAWTPSELLREGSPFLAQVLEEFLRGFPMKWGVQVLREVQLVTVTRLGTTWLLVHDKLMS